MATAITIDPAVGKMARKVAVPTRSAGACWIAGRGSVNRYATLARMYRVITRVAPITMARVTLRSAFFTSAAAKAMLCHESAENSDPV